MENTVEFNESHIATARRMIKEMYEFLKDEITHCELFVIRERMLRLIHYKTVLNKIDSDVKYPYLTLQENKVNKTAVTGAEKPPASYILKATQDLECVDSRHFAEQVSRMQSTINAQMEAMKVLLYSMGAEMKSIGYSEG
jgi:hypothetical protein